jgi:carbonic anhydrase/acetyltransferase-like protein (isoleucine patch superfamily)
MLLSYGGKSPVTGERCYVAPTAAVIGEVSLADDVSVWFGAAIRGDSAPITVGEGSNIQDNATVHCSEGEPAVIGRRVSVGHNAVVHSATLEDDVLVGMGAVVLNNAVIGAGSIVGAGAVVTKGTVIPPRSLVMGVPAKVVGTVLEGANLENAQTYMRIKETYRREQA